MSEIRMVTLRASVSRYWSPKSSGLSNAATIASIESTTSWFRSAKQ
jgi:hypothetical protein